MNNEKFINIIFKCLINKLQYEIKKFLKVGYFLGILTRNDPKIYLKMEAVII